MKTKLIGAMLLAGSALFAAPHISIGIGVGAPAYYPPVAAVRPPCPGPGYSWVDGYWAPNGAWVDGYWAAPYYDAPYVAPYYPEYRRDWDGDRDRGWNRDRDRDRDWDRGRDRDRHEEREGDHNRGRGYGAGFHR